MRALALGCLLCAVGLPAVAHAQELVYPRRPSQTNVRYADFDWKYIDVHVRKGAPQRLDFPKGGRLHGGAFRPPLPGESWAWPSVKESPVLRAGERAGATAQAPTAALRARPGSDVKDQRGAGGVRLYFYEREREIAQRAAASVQESYRYLQEQFGYTPEQTFAYFLYASYIEFLQTDLFPAQEGVLGVTSPETLEVTLPYFGDARLFADVSTHELAHEFTIQKIATVTSRADIVGDPLSATPLWFIEGLAEYYAKRGMDDEAEMLVRDIVVHPKLEGGYVLGSFWEDRMVSGLWTYKVGQARCAFLEETYGKGTLQRILEQLPLLFRLEEDGGVADFPRLVAKVAGASASSISARFERWVKRRAYRTFLNAKHDRGHFTTLHKTSGYVQALAAAPSGELVLYRSIDQDTGQNRLYLFDRRAPGESVVVAADGEPGVETLHPVAGRNFDLTDHALAFVAQDEHADVIYHQRFVEAALPEPCDADEQRTCGYDVEIELGDRRRFALAQRGIDAVESVALSPDGTQIALVGLHASGQRDVYLLDIRAGDEGTLTQLTRDTYAERRVSWGPDGIVFNSDATGHGKYNLFRLDPRAGDAVTRLTTEARDQLDPEVLPDGRVVFVAYDAQGANLYTLKGGELRRETAVSTGLFDPSAGPDGTLWALHHYGAERRPVRIPEQRLLKEPLSMAADPRALEAPRRLNLDRALPYEVLRLENWSLGSIFLLAGVSGDSVFGEITATASDRLRDHGLILSLSTFGDVALTEASLLYINQEQRVIWGGGPFNSVRRRFDRSFEASDELLFVSWERYFGLQGVVRYPFTRFSYLQTTLSAGGSEYFLLDDTRDALADPMRNPADRDLLAPWRAGNDGVRLQTEASLSLGYNTVGMHRATGPIRGSSVLLSTNAGVQPMDDMVYDQLRLDAERYFPITGAVNLMLRGGAGTTFGSERAPQYYLWSFRTLRGVPFGDLDYLLGREYVFGTLELQFPILELLSFPLIDLEGVLGVDTGAVADQLDLLWDRRLFDLVFGLNVGFGPLIVLLHFGQPIDIGPIAVPNDGDLTFNLSLNWRYD